MSVALGSSGCLNMPTMPCMSINERKTVHRNDLHALTRLLVQTTLLQIALSMSLKFPQATRSLYSKGNGIK